MALQKKIMYVLHDQPRPIPDTTTLYIGSTVKGTYGNKEWKSLNLWFV